MGHHGVGNAHAEFTYQSLATKYETRVSVGVCEDRDGRLLHLTECLV